MNAPGDVAPAAAPWTPRERAGLWLLAASLLPWAAVAALPFVAAEHVPGGRAIALTVLIGIAEALHLIGLAVAGPDLLRRLRERWRAMTARRRA